MNARFTCPWCTARIWDDALDFNAGDLVICAFCSMPSALDAELVLKPIKPKQLAELSQADQKKVLFAMHRTVLAIIDAGPGVFQAQDLPAMCKALLSTRPWLDER